MNQPAEALGFAERAAAIAQEIGSEELQWQIFNVRGAAYHQLKQPKQAEESFDAAIKINESRRLQLTSGAGTQNEKEVNSLAALYGAEHSQIYVKSEAREDRAKTESSNFKIVQFAAHSVFNDANPLYSYLLLSPNAATGADGLLEARELMNLNLSADLVVLSACETARGRIAAGEGLTGMTWALFVAGVPTTVASQWKVPSAGTSKIMLDFHRNLLRKGNTDKAASLRRAELNFLRNGAFQHPFYRAGFVLVGSN